MTRVGRSGRSPALRLAVSWRRDGDERLSDEADLRLRFDVLTKTKQPELHRYWTTRDRAANVRLYRLAAEILAAVEAGVFPPRVGWHCQDCPVRSRCWAWG